jgi:hypothetical protein
MTRRECNAGRRRRCRKRYEPESRGRGNLMDGGTGGEWLLMGASHAAFLRMVMAVGGRLRSMAALRSGGTARDALSA